MIIIKTMVSPPILMSYGSGPGSKPRLPALSKNPGIYYIYMVYPRPVNRCRMAHPLYFSSTHRRTCSTKR